MSYDIWEDVPVPVYLNFYFFNVTNSEAVQLGLEAPKLSQLGPYSYREKRQKVDISWLDGGNSVAFKQIKTWHFEQDKSGDNREEDEVVVLNCVVATAISAIRKRPLAERPFLVTSLNIAINSLGSPLFVKSTIREQLWEGYRDPLFDFINSTDLIEQIVSDLITIPFDRFGWFYTRNGSEEYDGNFQMDTGKAGLETLGEIQLWNGKDTTQGYVGECGRVKGSAGELFPPDQADVKKQTLFAADLCRALDLNFDSEVESTSKNINTNRYIADNAILDNATRQETLCNCNGTCRYPNGVLFVGACKYDTDAYISFPHYLYGDATLRQEVIGLEENPTFEDYGTYVELEPITGTPLVARARFQINIVVPYLENMTVVENITRKDILMPQIWFEQDAVISDDLVSDINLYLIMRKAVPPLGYAILGLGALVFLYSLNTFKLK